MFPRPRQRHSPFNPMDSRGFRAPRRPLAGLLFCLILPALFPCRTSAQFIRSSRLAAENDGFVFWTPPHDRTDRYYTNGLAAEAVLAWAPRWAKLLARDEPRVCPSVAGSSPCVLTRVTLGQSIYTPAWLFSPGPPIDDRPYAGWLYLRATTARVTPQGSRSFGVEVGVTGGPSLASLAHRWFHRTLGKAEPTGWDHQIPFELAFSVKYEVRSTVALLAQESGASFLLEPHGSFSLGTLRTGAVGGLSFKAGWNAPPRLDWWGPGSGPVYFLLTAGVEGELVLRDLFIDGSTWKESVHTELTPLVGRASAGLEIGTGPLGLLFAVTLSSIQFTTQQESHSVGKISIIIRP